MASTVKAVTKDSSPLSFMTRLSQHVYLYRPSSSTTLSPTTTTTTTTTPGNRPPPKLILVCSWMGARDPHIAKYITPYQALFPSTPILLIKSEMQHVFQPKTSWPDMQVTVPVLREIFGSEMLQHGSDRFGSSTTALSSSSTPTNDSTEKEEEDQPTLLIHLFSNGGSAQLLSLHHYLLQSESHLRLPPHLTIFDSAPGQIAYFPTYRALSHVLLPPSSRAGSSSLWDTLRRMFISPLLHIWVSLLWTSNFLSRLLKLRFLESPLERAAREQNDRTPGKGRAEREKGRMYFYSEEDELVGYRDVEAHMEEAMRKGTGGIRGEKFAGTGHVGHAKGEKNAERYWSCVRGFWEGEGWM
ncbi:hypothetical protein B0T13DRAFT_438446 [Neurospora crassa]|nr:hypothetical protein B0T13DRAFT_438446 [Neurospora crassa]